MWREESLCYLLVVSVAMITKFRITSRVVFELHLPRYPVEFWPKVRNLTTGWVEGKLSDWTKDLL
jgi:hypothetical protein